MLKSYYDLDHRMTLSVLKIPELLGASPLNTYQSSVPEPGGPVGCPHIAGFEDLSPAPFHPRKHPLWITVYNHMPCTSSIIC